MQPLKLRFFAAVILAFSVGAAHATDRPNIVWINAEDMSPHLGCYGHPDAITPNIDRLAEQGVVYRNAYATAPICSPSRSCLATGLYATSLGTQHLRCEIEIPQRVVPLATRLRDSGYFCTNTGKSDYNFNPDGIWSAWSSNPAPWRARKPGQPFFAFITVGETHEGRINTRDRYEQATANLAAEQRHDPSKVTIPPFYPDTPEIRRIFAGMYDLATVFDNKVGELISQLNDDGDLDDTFVFVFGDHGNGLPRYKRWLNDSGLRVPLVIHVPSNFKHLSPHKVGSQTDQLVSFVDYPATAMSLAGEDVPDIMQGVPFLGKTVGTPREYMFGARSRADDMFEMSRSAFDGRYFYVRHFMPHLPYIQPSVIFGDRKDSLRELRRQYEAGNLDEHAVKFWMKRKPLEELYDLQSDPHELKNLAGNAEYETIRKRLSGRMFDWMVAHRDSGLLPEAEYQIRARNNGDTPFDAVQDPARFDLDSTMNAASRVGKADVSAEELSRSLTHNEAGVRYWASVAALAGGEAMTVADELTERLADESPSVRIAAAEALLSIRSDDPSRKERALATLGEVVRDDRPWVALQAARAIALQGKNAASLVDVMKQVVNKNKSAPRGRRVYKDFNYASFTGWALETGLLACGEDEFIAELNSAH